MTGDWAISRKVRISTTLSVARNTLLGEVAERMGGNVLLVEL